MKGILSKMNLADHPTVQSTMDRYHVRGDTLPRDLTTQQWAGLYSGLITKSDSPSGTTAHKKGTTMRKNKPQKNSRTEAAAKPSTKPTSSAGGVLGPDAPGVGAFGARSAVTGETPAISEKPVTTAEIPIIGADIAAKKVEAPIPGIDPKVKAHHKGHLPDDRGGAPQRQKGKQPQPRWNLPRRQG